MDIICLLLSDLRQLHKNHVSSKCRDLARNQACVWQKHGTAWETDQDDPSQSYRHSCGLPTFPVWAHTLSHQAAPGPLLMEDRRLKGGKEAC